MIVVGFLFGGCETIIEQSGLNIPYETILRISSKQAGDEVLQRLAAIDFEHKMLILLLLPYQYTEMIQVRIDELRLSRGTINVFATKLVPSGGAVTTDIGFPCHVVVVGRSEADAKLVALREAPMKL